MAAVNSSSPCARSAGNNSLRAARSHGGKLKAESREHFHACVRGDCEERRESETAEVFHGLFYGLKIFRCKTAQFCVTPCESEMAETPNVRNGAQAGENTRKKSFLNYKSAALPAELCRRFISANRLVGDPEDLSKCIPRFPSAC
jgi:hypothetical protein